MASAASVDTGLLTWKHIHNTREDVMRIISRLLMVAALAAAPLASHAGTVVKDVDDPLGTAILGTGFSTIYANSFVAPNDGVVTEMGVWLRNSLPGAIRFQVYESLDDDVALGPDSTRVLPSSPVDTGAHPDLAFVDFDGCITDLGSLVGGHTYWLAATVVGLDSNATYNNAMHIPNTDGIVDNGTFMWSDDPAGLFFKGPFSEPFEMAFSVTVSPVPEPAGLAMLAFGLPLVALGARRRGRGTPRVR